MTYRVRSAEDRRAEIQAHAAQLGIDEAFISDLVETFYQRVRAHAVLGPIFAEAVEDWDAHMPKMKDFWSTVALSTGRYTGRPVPAHQALNNVSEGDFATWLSVFEETLEDIAPTPAAVPYFMERAERIARSLQLAMFGLPNLKSNISS